MSQVNDGHIDITLERGLKDRAQRTLLDIDLGLESGEIELIAPIEARLSQLVSSMRVEYLSMPEKIKAMLYTVYGIDINIGYLDEAIYDAMSAMATLEG